MTKGHKDSTLLVLSLESTRNVWPRKSHESVLLRTQNGLKWILSRSYSFHFENFDSHL